MARRTKEEALETREQLLDAAQRVFRERGVGHASLAEVADAAGVTRGAVYHHFESKAELFQALTARAEMPIDTAFEDFQNQDIADPLALFRQQGLQALEHLTSSAQIQNIFEVIYLRCEYTDDLAPVGVQHVQDRLQCLGKCQAVLDQAVAKGQLPADTDTHLAAHGALAFVGGLMRDWVEAPDTFDLKAAGPQLIDTYVAGLRVNPPRRRAVTEGAQ